jgi:signal peptidase I
MRPAARRAGTTAAVAALAGLAVWARRRLVAVTVEGLSMYPAYRPGDRVLVHRRPLAAVRVGDVVVVERPVPGSGWEELPPFDGRLAGRHWNLKRVAAVGVPPGTLVVLGDNPHSEDSKQWGPFPGERLLGVVVTRLPRRAVG